MNRVITFSIDCWYNEQQEVLKGNYMYNCYSYFTFSLTTISVKYNRERIICNWSCNKTHAVSLRRFFIIVGLEESRHCTEENHLGNMAVLPFLARMQFISLRGYIVIFISTRNRFRESFTSLSVALFYGHTDVNYVLGCIKTAFFKFQLSSCEIKYECNGVLIATISRIMINFFAMLTYFLIILLFF